MFIKTVVFVKILHLEQSFKTRTRHAEPYYFLVEKDTLEQSQLCTRKENI